MIPDNELRNILNQTGTDTGRFDCSKPNIANVPSDYPTAKLNAKKAQTINWKFAFENLELKPERGLEANPEWDPKSTIVKFKIKGKPKTNKHGNLKPFVTLTAQITQPHNFDSGRLAELQGKMIPGIGRIKQALPNGIVANIAVGSYISIIIE